MNLYNPIRLFSILRQPGENEHLTTHCFHA
jgi:hypothetical protein